MDQAKYEEYCLAQNVDKGKHRQITVYICVYAWETFGELNKCSITFKCIDSVWIVKL